MMRRLDFLHSSSLPCCLLFFFSSTPSLLIAFSLPGAQKWMPQLQNFHETCETRAWNKDCSCVFEVREAFLSGTTCGAVDPPPPPPAPPPPVPSLSHPRFPVGSLCWKICPPSIFTHAHYVRNKACGYTHRKYWLKQKRENQEYENEWQEANDNQLDLISSVHYSCRAQSVFLPEITTEKTNWHWNDLIKYNLQQVVFLFLTIFTSMITFKKLHIYTTISNKYLTRTSRKSSVIPTVQTHANRLCVCAAKFNDSNPNLSLSFHTSDYFPNKMNA